MSLPTPYHHEPGIDLYCGDMRELVPAMIGEGIVPNLVLADPPYGETSLAWDRWPDGWPDVVLPLLLPASGSLWCFGSMRMFLEHAADFARYRFAQDLVWEKQNGSSFADDRFRRVHENLAQFYPRQVKWEAVYREVQYTNDATARTVRRVKRPKHLGEIGEGSYATEQGGPKLMRSVLYVPSCHGHAIHPTQKPVGILHPAIAYSVPPGGLILDPFAGSASTLLAAKRSGRRAIGIEIREEACEAAVRELRGWLPLVER